ncbi:hypothetical protein JCM17844_19720 [Iodidimonas gelatinilytica]|uniref:Uncharacterized protein n=1 Tax=Iodidimonas gelatinilytica TaxID=1236966 RepID=A0A5A7N4U6_9PROT|nr:hypothetical protein [Iodidimonas gelatinilytica]GEQ98335.1 hypothetical protein JCM17844_19720 [Iodidimonas gelatinilytica]GER02086.1 hypothetical protein JCM17845_27090 [Iodidimonas gelatinilytica]
MISLFAAASIALFSAPEQADRPVDIPVEQCAFSEISKALAGHEQWHDLADFFYTDPELAAEFSEMMPGFKMAYLHADSTGVLLVGGERLSRNPSEPQQNHGYWAQAVDETQEACAQEGVACDVEAFSEAPFGLSASTYIQSDADRTRRETLAFVGGNQCVYSIQFSGPESAISDDEWQDLKVALLDLRALVKLAPVGPR